MNNLSKSRFLIGQQCAKQLWWTVREPDAPELKPAAEAVAVVRGRGVGELARRHVPGGVLIDLPHYEVEGRVAATKQALAKGARVVYEGSIERHTRGSRGHAEAGSRPQARAQAERR